jgi:hypothetical protein
MCASMFKQALGLLQKLTTTMQAWPFPKQFYFLHFIFAYETGLA